MLSKSDNNTPYAIIILHHMKFFLFLLSFVSLTVQFLSVKEGIMIKSLIETLFSFSVLCTLKQAIKKNYRNRDKI